MGKEREMIAAVSDGDVDRAGALLDEQPGLANAKADNGDSAVLVAGYRGHRDMLDLLLRRGAAVSIFEAAVLGDAGRAAAHLEGDASLATSYSHDGWTPLHLAAHFGQREVAALLLAHGADVGARSRSELFAARNTPLHAAAAGGGPGLAKLLVDHGAEVDARDGAGWTPLLIASNQDSAETAAVLIDAGVNAANGDKTPLGLAKAGSRQDIAALLEERGARA